MKTAEKRAGPRGKIIAALCCISSVLMCYSMLTPILAEIGKSFPEAPAEQVQMVFSIVALASLPGTLGAGALGARVSGKKLAAAGMVILLAGGLLPTVLHSRLWMLYLSSILVGIGMGLTNVTSAAMISTFFKGLEKGKILGLQAAFLSLGAAVFSFLGGKVADWAGWRWSFLVYLLGVPMLVVFLRFIPDEKAQPPAKTGRLAYGKLLNQRFLRLVGIAFLMNLFITGFQTNIALFIEEAGYGSVTLTSVLSALFMLIGLPVGLGVGAYLKLLRHRAGAVTLLVGGVGMLCIAFSRGVAPVVVGAFLMGMSFSANPPTAIGFASSLVPAELAAAGIALYHTVCNLGKFLSPYALGMLSRVTDGTFRASFLVSGVGLAVLGAVYLLLNPVRPENVA